MVSRDHLVGEVMCGWNAFQEIGVNLVERASGPHFWDPAGKQYIDWNMGWGSLLLGHDPPEIKQAMLAALEQGFGFQYESTRTAELASRIAAHNGVDRVRLATTGTGSTMFAVRVARQATGRKIMIKFEGHFHGMNESLFWGTDTMADLKDARPDGSYGPIPSSAGMLADDCSEYLLVLPFNDLDALEKAFAAHKGEIAGVILEPISLNVGCIRPDDGYLEALRRMCDDAGSLLIFDEMRTGFRVAKGGATELLGVEPDLRTYGKALGGGMPIAALAGKAEYMDLLGPVGPVGMGGTNNGRNFVVHGALAALEVMGRDGFYDELGEKNDYFVEKMSALLAEHGVPGHVEGYGGTIGVYLGTEERPRSYRDVREGIDRDYHRRCLAAAHEKGLFAFTLLLSRAPEVVVLSMAHTREIIDETLTRYADVLKANPYKKA